MYQRVNIEEILSKVKTLPSESIESEIIEFKNYANENALHNCKALAEEVSAFANKSGGIIIIGVVDSSDIKNKTWQGQLNGFERIDLDITKQRLTGKLKPFIDLKIHYYLFEGNNYLCIHVPKRTDTIVATAGGKICIRDGKSSRPASPDEITNLVKSLQFYDWSAEDIDIDIIEALDSHAVYAAKQDYCHRRKIDISEIETKAFLESINATRNGILNKSGLLFLGKSSFIRQYLGNYEYRFSWRTKSGQLVLNDVWADCLWNTITKAKTYFNSCNNKLSITYKGENFEFDQLDSDAFHEAYLNAMVHRDYSHSGMVSVNYTEKQLTITSPGGFYGGITSDNIVYHEPRHRNKNLASTLMLFQLVDRAGIGITRIGLRSLMYGRSFPKFIEKDESIEVVMDAEFFRPAIFVITRLVNSFGVVELFILNSVFGVGHISIPELEKRLRKIVEKPWDAIKSAMDNDEIKKYVRYSGTNKGIYICVTDTYFDFFEVKKKLKSSSTSEKHVALFSYLKEYGSCSNEEISSLFGHKHASQTSVFLRKAEYVKKGKSIHSKWILDDKL
ncbi:RNA-binding domain-containing protein [Pseudocnuella soli]|uniref:RNA-binding domain-containing protein n=1 Tax=Pseudocnuella soli TaxID=2502779 RepID=UPI00104966D7|nr:RNA-binding domain-containing protein [Pseudocnuella soli]